MGPLSGDGTGGGGGDNGGGGDEGGDDSDGRGAGDDGSGGGNSGDMKMARLEVVTVMVMVTAMQVVKGQGKQWFRCCEWRWWQWMESACSFQCFLRPTCTLGKPGTSSSTCPCLLDTLLPEKFPESPFSIPVPSA